MKSDLIACWPKHIDYPLWRQFIKENRKHFDKVIVVFTDMNVANLDYRQFIQDQMNPSRLDKKIIFLDCLPVEANEDWRNKAVNMALSISDNEWVYFTEQDFLPIEKFWREIDAMAKRVDVFGYYQDQRLHPCCIFIKRELLNRTSKNFGVVTDKLDHFGKLQEDLEKKDILIGVVKSYLGKHMNGLSQNLHMLQTGIEPNYNPEEFKEYCRRCLEIESLHSDFNELFNAYIS